MAKSILSPFIPKNKFILKDMLKKYENIRKPEDFSAKKLTFSKQTIKKPLKIFKKLHENTSGKKILTSAIDQNDFFSDFLEQKIGNFSIFVRRRSCFCSCCGQNSKFHDKINNFFPQSKLKYDIMKEKNLRKVSLVANSSNSILGNKTTKLIGKIKANFISSATLRSQTQLSVTNIFSRSSILRKNYNGKKNSMNLFDNSMNRKGSIIINNESFNRNEVIGDKGDNIDHIVKEGSFCKKIKEEKIWKKRNLSENCVFEAIKWKFRPDGFVESLLKKNQEKCRKITHAEGVNSHFQMKNRGKSLSFFIQSKENVIKSVYDSKDEIKYFRNLLSGKPNTNSGRTFNGCLSKQKKNENSLGKAQI